MPDAPLLLTFFILVAALLYSSVGHGEARRLTPVAMRRLLAAVLVVAGLTMLLTH